jgi:hypothetical protein
VLKFKCKTPVPKGWHTVDVRSQLKRYGPKWNPSCSVQRIPTADSVKIHALGFGGSQNRFWHGDREWKRYIANQILTVDNKLINESENSKYSICQESETLFLNTSYVLPARLLRSLAVELTRFCTLSISLCLFIRCHSVSETECVCVLRWRESDGLWV